MNVIKANELQRGSAVTTHVRKAKVVFCPIIHDYEPGMYFGVLFLSFRLHMESPTYLYKRIENIKQVKDQQRVLVVLLLVDIDTTSPRSVSAIGGLETECLSFGAQIIPVGSCLEAAKYIECMHLNENVSKELVRNYKYTVMKQKIEIEKTGIMDVSPEYARKTLFLSSMDKLTLRDANLLLAQNISLRQIIERASAFTLTAKGMGPIKRKAMHAFIHTPFHLQS